MPKETATIIVKLDGLELVQASLRKFEADVQRIARKQAEQATPGCALTLAAAAAVAMGTSRRVSRRSFLGLGGLT